MFPFKYVIKTFKLALPSTPLHVLCEDLKLALVS